MIALLLLACATTPQPPLEEFDSLVFLPTPGPLPTWSPPVPEQTTLENGLHLVLLQDTALPLVSVRLLLPGGTVADPPEAWGFTWLAAEMMEESTDSRTTAEVADEVKRLGATFSVDAERMAVEVSMDLLSDRFEEGMDLLADAVLHPAFLEADWDRVKGLHIEGLDRRWEEGRLLATDVANLHFYGAKNPLGWPMRGTPESVGRVYRERVARAQAAFAVPGGSTLVVVGDVDAARVEAAVSGAFGDWSGAATLPALPAAMIGPAGGARTLVVDLPGASQTALHVTAPGPAPGAEAEVAAVMAGVVLGGSFTSRLNQLLREEKGYTYGARASFGAHGTQGVFHATTSVVAESTGAALVDLLGELQDERLTFTDKERHKARAQELADALDTGETRAGLAARYASLVRQGLGPEAFSASLGRMGQVSFQDMEQVAKRWLAPERRLVVLVGDVAQVGPLLDAAAITYERVEAPR
jgi:predicted Zn-dependent peptidase